MRIIGLLSWFDEDPAFLTRALGSHADAGLLDALVAAYSYYAERDSRQVEQSPSWIVTGPDGYPLPANAEDELA